MRSAKEKRALDRGVVPHMGIPSREKSAKVVLDTPSSCGAGSSTMTTTLAFSLIAALLMGGIIADSCLKKGFPR